MQFDREKYIDLLMYVLSKSYNKPHFGKTVLCTILYLVDFNYYNKYGRFLTHETYIKSKKGIKPKHFKEISEELIAKKHIFLRKESYYHRTIHRYYLIIIPTVQFNKKEHEIIDLTINKLVNNNAYSITKYVKNNHPVIKTEFGEKINYMDNK
ncbi:type II toxin-antitoxin system antitoxin SocA domain-containing protein [Methanobrevibacter sp.]|uniref:type II toxin-antitoxin system antitoxin SocA domain-containing protein n=1 Tax=Methanobrevibacter sp. TaxID=66852 RepID=UPI0038902A05